MQRELTQSTVKQLNDQLQESFGRLEEEYDGEEEDEEEEDEEEGEDQEGPDAPLEEIDESDELKEDTQETVEDTPDVKAIEKEVETAIEELDAVMTETIPKKRGKKPQK